MPAHDEAIGGGDAMQWLPFGDSQNERVIQAARTLEHGPTTTAPPQHRDFFHSANFPIDLLRHSIPVTEHDKITVRLPKPENLIGAVDFAEIEQRLVAREVFLGRGQNHIKAGHIPWLLAKDW